MSSECRNVDASPAKHTAGVGSLLLIRHARTVANEEGVLLGRSDSPLSTTGMEQVNVIENALRDSRPNAVFSSTLGRARLTVSGWSGTSIASALLDEIDFGLLEGSTVLQAELAGHFLPDGVLAEEDWSRCWPEGESLHDVMERSARFVRDELASNLSEGARVVVVGHKISIACLALTLLNVSRSHFASFVLGSGEALAIDLSKSSWSRGPFDNVVTAFTKCGEADG